MDNDQNSNLPDDMLPNETPEAYKKRTGKFFPLLARPKEEGLEEGDITDYVPNPKGLVKGAALGIGGLLEKDAIEGAAKAATPVWKTMENVGKKAWDTVGSGIKVMGDEVNPANSRSLQLEKLKKLFGG